MCRELFLRIIHCRGITPCLLPVCLLLAGCGEGGRGSGAAAGDGRGGALTQSAYVWQRVWTEAVRRAVAEHGREFQSLAVLGAQVSADAQKTFRPAVAWPALASCGAKVAVVVRLEKPLPPEPDALVLGEARRLLSEAAAAGLTLAEVQVDYDAPQKKLAAYTPWLRKVERALEPLPVRITTLASWLGEPEFRALTAACDGYILQVHSFDPPAPGERAAVCDVRKARAWVAQAAGLGRGFTVALPTYRTTAGYDAAGKLAGVETDGVAPQWPAGTVRYEFPSPAADLAALVAEWMKQRPAGLEGVIWYRLPVATDSRNWGWPALRAVMAGRAPASRLEVKFSGGSPLDAVLSNTGEQDEWLPPQVMLSWDGPPPAAGDAVAGWTLTTAAGRAVFSSAYPGARLLPPGKSAALGWLRFYESAPHTIRPSFDSPAAAPAGDR